MRRPALAVVVLVAVLLVSALVLRQSLRQGPLRAAAEARLSAALGQPVAIGGLAVSFVPRLALTGSDVRVGEAGAEAPGLSVHRVRILPNTRALLSRRVDLEEIQLDGLTVNVLQEADGGWRVPAAAPAPGATDDGLVRLTRVRVVNGRIAIHEQDSDGIRERGAIEAIDTIVTLEEGGLVLPDITARIGGARISGDARTDASSVRLTFSAEEIRHGDLPSLLALAGSAPPDLLRLDGPASLTAAVHVDRSTARVTGRGELRAPTVRIEPLRLERFEASFNLDGDRLSFAPTTFSMHGGTHEGTLAVVLSRRAPQWAAQSRLRGVDVAAFLAALTGRDQRIDGRADVTADVRGRLDRGLAESLAGRADLIVTDGLLRDFPLVAAVNRALRLAEAGGRDTRFERLTGSFALGESRARTENLVLDAGHTQARLAGTIGFDRALNLRGTAAISAERTAAAVASIRELARLRRPGGEIQVPLTITGTADSPEFGIDVQSLLQQGVEDEVKRRLLDLLRRGRGGGSRPPW